jgi:hypothetical protein
MGLSTIILEKSAIQASNEEEEICMQIRDNFYSQILGSKERAETWE